MTSIGNQQAALRLQSILDPHTCTRRGMCPVGCIRRQREPLESRSLYFEVHGSGPQKIVFIMGLNNTSSSWLPQVNHFGKLEQYSVLVFDNRGVGMSWSPLGPYSTSRMAQDVICLLAHLQWTEDRSLHVVGASLGGMIAQELAYRIFERIMSLSLVVTGAGGKPWTNTPPLSGCLFLTRLLVTSDPHKKIQIVEKLLFPDEWLDSLATGESEGRTNRDIHREFHYRRMEVIKPQKLKGTLGQMAACLTHSMTPDKLSKICTSVPKVLILSASEDMVIPHTEGEKLKRYMPKAEYQCWEKAGHGISAQHSERFNQLLTRVFAEGKGA